MALAYGPPQASASSHSTRGSAVPIPRPPSTNSQSSILPFPRSTPVAVPTVDEPAGDEHRNSFSSFSSRYASPRTASGRFSSDYGSSSFGERISGSSPLGQLKRPKDRRRPIPVPQGFDIRREGFEARGFSGDSAGAVADRPHLFQPAVQPSPPKKPGLLSRTFSSGLVNNDVLKEKLEHCLDRQPSIGQETSGEAAAHLRELQAKAPVFSAPVVTLAFNIASFSYGDKLGSGGQPLMKQCAATAYILAELGADEKTVAAALLKDVLLQSMMTEEQLYMHVPKVVADLVCKVGRLDDLCQARQEMVEAAKGAPLDPQASQRISHLLLTMADVHGVLIKLADRLSAMRAAVPGSLELLRSAREALDVFAPMANRLGVWSIKAALEDLAFQALHPVQHSELQAKLKESQDRGTLEAALDTLSGALAERGLQGVDLSGRPKNLYGVMRKMRDKQYGLNEVYDVRALRVVVKSKADCYAVLQEVHRIWPEVKNRFKDYIRTPKANGYQSLHTVVMAADGQPMEIQIRTDKMHFIAEYGVAAHWRYKERDRQTAEQAESQQVNWARWLINWTLELKDYKCRPKGSPPGDSALATLASQICSFPTHAPDCKFAEFAARMLPQPVSEEVLTSAPVLVVLLDHTKGQGEGAAPPGTCIEELPPRCTTGQLAAVLGTPANAHILVNQEEARRPDQVLRHGDRVEIFSPPPQPLSAAELDAQRERLQRLFRRSPTHGKPQSASNSSWDLQKPVMK